MREIYDKLTPVRNRQKAASVLRHMGRCMLAAAIVSAVLAIANCIVGVSHLRLAGWIVLASGPIVGIVLALVSRGSWSVAARAVDRHFRLDDRVQSAVAFLEGGNLSGLYALQVSDAAAHLAKLNTKAAVRVGFTKSAGASVVVVIAAAALLVFLPDRERTRAMEEHDSPPVAKPDATNPKTKATLPVGVVWQPAANDKVLRQSDDALPFGEATTAEETNVRLDFDERYIDLAYTPTFKTTE
jgi:hypothetical protein